jgi:hypothetical protein
MKGRAPCPMRQKPARNLPRNPTTVSATPSSSAGRFSATAGLRSRTSTSAPHVDEEDGREDVDDRLDRMLDVVAAVRARQCQSRREGSDDRRRFGLLGSPCAPAARRPRRSPRGSRGGGFCRREPPAVSRPGFPRPSRLPKKEDREGRRAQRARCGELAFSPPLRTRSRAPPVRGRRRSPARAQDDLALARLQHLELREDTRRDADRRSPSAPLPRKRTSAGR